MTIYKKKQVDEDVLALIQESLAWAGDGSMCRIVEQLAPKDYKRVMAVLETFGGKWRKDVSKQWAANTALPGNLGKGAIVFDGDPREQIGLVVVEGSMTVVKDGFFPTPDAVIERMAEGILPYPHESRASRFLEPSAGDGHICNWLVANGHSHPASIGVCELAPHRAEMLRAAGFRFLGYNFLSLQPEPVYDYVLMNPPFESAQEIQHIRHAYEFLAPGGKLASVASAGVTFREDKAYMSFREWLLENDGTVTPLPVNSFKESGTGVNTVLVFLRKGRK